MKNLGTLLLLFLFSLSLSAQEKEEDYTQFMLFPAFADGLVVLKDGTRGSGLFNYSLLNEKIVFFDEDNNVITFADPSSVGVVIIGDRIFENVKKNTFYERIPIGDNYYYVYWKAKWISNGKDTSHHGARSQSFGAVNYKVADSGTGTSLRFKTNDGMDMIPVMDYYLKIKNNFKKFDSADSLAKLIGNHKDEIKEYAKQENIDFKNPDDINRIMQYISPYINQ